MTISSFINNFLNKFDDSKIAEATKAPETQEKPVEAPVEASVENPAEAPADNPVWAITEICTDWFGEYVADLI